MDVPPPIYAAPAYTGSVVLDVQCFKDDANRYVVKEACAVDVDTGAVLLHHIARPPYPRDRLSVDKQRECEWLSRCYHGLDWRQGDIDYSTLLDKLRACLHRRYAVYVKGEEKRDFVLDNLVPADANVRELGGWAAVRWTTPPTPSVAATIRARRTAAPSTTAWCYGLGW